MGKIHELKDLPLEIAELVSGRDAASGLVCPACAGGRSGERSFGFHRAGFLVWLKCHRAGCGYTGVVPIAGQGLEIARPAFNPRPYKGPLERPGSALTELLLHRYGISPLEAATAFLEPSVGTFECDGLPYGPVEMPRAVYMPVKSRYGEDRGGVLRFLDGSKPKTVSYLTTDQPRLAWYVRHSLPRLAPAVVVEDQLSAVRCRQLGYNAVALMGTSINDAKAREIRGDRPVLLALDKDAFGKACEYARRWPWMTPVLLDHDIKDSLDCDVRARLAQALGEAHA